MRVSHLGAFACVAVLMPDLALAQHAPLPSTPAKAPAKRIDLSALVKERIDSALKAAADDGDVARASAELRKLFDQLIAYAPESGEPLMRAALAVRLTSQLASVEKDSRGPLLAYLRKHEELARLLPAMARREQAPKSVYAVLNKLRAAFGDEPGKYPDLTAAICLVHSHAITARASVRENVKPRLIDPVEVFRYYTRNEGRMVYAARTLPAELLVFMVDSRAETDELYWALDHYAGDHNPGNHYNELVYDTASFKFDKPKKIEALDYTLPNLRQVGGVCEERAYFASNVGKAIGVPSVYISGSSATDSHAWVGVMMARGSELYWKLDEGCFGDYKKLRGHVTDPLGSDLSAPELNMIAQAASAPERDRLEAVAYADAAQRLVEVGRRKQPWPPEPIPGMEGAPALAADAPGALRMMEKAVGLTPTSPSVWGALAPMAAAMTSADRAKWTDALLRCCDPYPDFVHRTLGIMIDGLKDPKERAGSWEAVSKQTPRRIDLKVEALLAAGRAWEQAGDKSAAFEDYQEIWLHCLNDTAEAVQALTAGESLLKAGGKAPAILDMYADAFRRVARPSHAGGADSFSSSNFYRVGRRYATLLEQAGRVNEARQVRGQLQAGETKDR